jgi:hypothetical protein
VSKSVAAVGVPVLGGTVYFGVTDFVFLRAPECDDGDCGTVEKVQDAVVHPPVSDSQLMNAVAQWSGNRSPKRVSFSAERRKYRSDLCDS